MGEINGQPRAKRPASWVFAARPLASSETGLLNLNSPTTNYVLRHKQDVAVTHLSMGIYELPSTLEGSGDGLAKSSGK